MNQQGWDSNLAKTHTLPTEIIHLASAFNEAQFLDTSLQKEFSEKQSDREEVVLFREKDTRQGCAISEGERPRNMAWLVLWAE